MKGFVIFDILWCFQKCKDYSEIAWYPYLELLFNLLSL